MRININIEKKHLIFFSIFLIIIGSSFVIAEWGPSKPFHETLYTNVIEAKSGNIIQVMNNLKFMDGTLFGKVSNDNGIALYATEGKNVYLVDDNFNTNDGSEVIINSDIKIHGKICNKEDNCISMNEIIEEGTPFSEDIIKRPSGISNNPNPPLLPVEFNQKNAEIFCSEEGYEGVGSKQSINCGNRLVATYDSNINKWVYVDCRGSTTPPGEYIASINCINKIETIEHVEASSGSNAWGNSRGWTKRCPTGKSVVGLKQELTQDDNGPPYKIYLICK